MAKRLIDKISNKNPVRKKSGSTKPINPKARRTKDIKKSSLSRKKPPLSKLSAVRKEELKIEEAKYFLSPMQEPSGQKQRKEYLQANNTGELPAKYDRDIIIIQARDPWWLYAYWQVKDGTFERVKSELGQLYYTAKQVLRIYDVSFIDFNGYNAHRFFDIELCDGADNWYIDTMAAGRSWCVDFGLRLSDSRFITIVRSNVTTTPADGPSCITDEEWMVPEDIFIKLYGTSIGIGTSPVKSAKPWVELRKRQFASGGISSFGLSPVKKQASMVLRK